MKFYRFSDKDVLNKVAYVTNDSWDVQDVIDILYGNKIVNESPIKVEHKWGKKWADILCSINVILPVVSQKFIDILTINNLTGWEAYEVIIDNKLSEFDSKYYILVITGRSKNTIIDICKNKMITDWDGSDLFLLQDISKVYISERAYHVLSKKDHKFTNIKLVSFESDIEYFLEVNKNFV
ncbi:MAG: hypothetical protein ACK4LB_05635 [Spirosomataceae bacterium]